MNLYQTSDRILDKMIERCRIGWIDCHHDSYDKRTAMARAVRIQLRLSGQRITLEQARNL